MYLQSDGATVEEVVPTVLGEDGISVHHAPQLGLWVVRGWLDLLGSLPVPGVRLLRLEEGDSIAAAATVPIVATKGEIQLKSELEFYQGFVRLKVAIKNNLAEKAAEGLAAGSLLRGLAGMTSLAYTAADPVALAKALTTFKVPETAPEALARLMRAGPNCGHGDLHQAVR